MERIADKLDSINQRIASVVRWLVLMMVLVQFSIVVGRYVFGVNSIAVQESVLYMHAALFMLAAGYTLLVDKHVRVDVFYAKASDNTQRVINLFGHVFFLFPTNACTVVMVLAVGSQPMEDIRRAHLSGGSSGGISCLSH